MPSAAKQKLSSELWGCGKGQIFCPSPGNSNSVSEMHVSPGQFYLPKEKQHYCGSKKGSSKLQKHCNQERRSSRIFSRKGSASGALSDPETESFIPVLCEKNFVEMSSSPQSDSGLNYSSQTGPVDVYAMNNSPAPDPSELPFPPLEWLQPSTGKASPVSSEFGSFNLQNIFGCSMVA
ncbi:hypothetical protein PoB_006344300 [Plakobranchus ocellatus]|uniref:Uncharacterized protein n=1 Tax=Plakobranchus ocellatus TaxID=259542 RepID=A0AAV4CYP6_9GAST|nr:hypothetical protein PoB_006344300 [Plakobranchus ocellatus]